MFQFRDEKDEDGQLLTREINTNTGKIAKLSNSIHMKNQCIAYLTMINDWYIQENDEEICRGSDETELEHLVELNSFFTSYAGQLTEIDECMKQIIEILADCFDYEAEGVQRVIRRVEKDL